MAEAPSLAQSELDLRTFCLPYFDLLGLDKSVSDLHYEAFKKRAANNPMTIAPELQNRVCCTGPPSDTQVTVRPIPLHQPSLSTRRFRDHAAQTAGLKNYKIHLAKLACADVEEQDVITKVTYFGSDDVLSAATCVIVRICDSLTPGLSG
jgi:hypothetical protein